MKKTILFGVLSLTLLVVLSAGREVYSFGGCEEDCGKCHSLEKKEVQQILTKFKAADAKVVDIKMSPIRGLWEVAIEDKGNPGVMYVGFSKKHVMGGTIFEVDTALNKTQETLNGMRQAVEKYVEVSKIPLDDSIVMGDADARHKVIVFTDPDCPFCGKLHNELKKVVSERKDIAFYLKLMPLKFHPDAYWKSQSIICSRSKALQLLEENFINKPIPKPDCQTKSIDDNLKLAGELGITGTPTLIMPDGLVVIGAQDAGKITEQVLNPKKKEEPK